MRPPPIQIQEKTYFFHSNGVAEGPVTLGLLKSLVQAGHLPKTTMIKGKSGDEWSKIEDVINPPNFGKKNSQEPFQLFLAALIVSGVLLFFIGIFFLNDLSKSSEKVSESRKSASLAFQPTPTPRPASQATSYRPASTPITTFSTSRQSANHRPVPAPETSTTPAAAWTSTTPVPKKSTASSTGYSSGSEYKSETKISHQPTPQPEFRTYTSADGTTYSVSNADYYRLSAIRERISKEEAAIQTAQNALLSLGDKIDSRRALVNSYSQKSVNDFNALVSQYERQRVQLNAKIDNFNRDVNSFNAELERVGRRLR